MVQLHLSESVRTGENVSRSSTSLSPVSSSAVTNPSHANRIINSLKSFSGHSETNGTLLA